MNNNNGAFAIILNSNQEILLCHRRDHDIWNLPGGKIEPNESPWECVVREIKEETGLDANVERLTGVYYKSNNDTLVFNFKCQVIGGELITTEESDQNKYFSLNNLPPNTLLKQVERLEDFFNQPKLTTFKSQTSKPLALLKDRKYE